MYCLLQLCHHKYTDTKTLSKRHVVDLKTFFVITSSHPTLHFTISSLVLLPSPVTLSVLSFSACWPFLLDFFQKILQYFSLRERLFCVAPVQQLGEVSRLVVCAACCHMTLVFAVMHICNILIFFYCFCLFLFFYTFLKSGIDDGGNFLHGRKEIKIDIQRCVQYILLHLIHDDLSSSGSVGWMSEDDDIEVVVSEIHSSH